MNGENGSNIFHWNLWHSIFYDILIGQLLKKNWFIYKLFTFKLRIDQWPNFPLMIRNVNFNNEPIIKPSELYSNTVSWIRRSLWVPESFVCCNGTLPGGNLLSRQSAATAWINHSIQLQLVLFDLLWPK